jgi:hypothetical protein
VPRLVRTFSRPPRAAPAARGRPPANGRPRSVHVLIELQQAYGNAFVQRLIQDRSTLPRPGGGPAGGPAGGPGADARGERPPAPAAPAAISAATAAEVTRPPIEAPGAGEAEPPSEAPAAAEAAPIAAEDEAVFAEAAPIAAEADMRFRGVLERLERAAGAEKAHEPAPRKVAEARAAAVPPANERTSRAAAGQVEVMAAQQPGRPDPGDFLSVLREALRRVAPRNMDEAERFKSEGRAGQLREILAGAVGAQKDAAVRDIRSATVAEPNAGRVSIKESTPLRPESADRPPPDLGAEQVLPTPKAEAEISVERNRRRAEALMAEHDLDEAQLERANGPQFDEALRAKQALEVHADRVPEAYRAEERAHLSAAEAAVRTQAQRGASEMRAGRARVGAAVRARQLEAKRREEAERKRVADQLERIYARTRQKVEGILGGLDGEVGRLFDEGERGARERFESYVDRRMADYKWERYLSTPGGLLLWARDKLLGLPDEVNRFYEEGRERYVAEMDAVLVRIGGTVEARLAEARAEIARGRDEIRAYVAGLPAELRRAGQEAERDVSARFDELAAGVDAKKQELAQGLAERYRQSRDALDERIKQLKAESSGLVDELAGKLAQVVAILRDFKARISSLLGQAGDTIRQIVKDPIRFLGNLIDAVKRGFGQFSEHILEHLKSGLLGWLFGALAAAGIEVPSELSLKAIFGLVMQVLGLTREYLRGKLVQLIGARNVGRIERAWEVVSTLIREGLAGLWERAKRYLGDLYETVVGGIREWVVAQIVKQGVLWLVSLFNPASALLKAIQAIYGVITFFVERIDQIRQLVEAIVGSTARIVAGDIAAAGDWIERTLGRAVPVMISFLANLLGLSGISERIRALIGRVQAKVDQAIDRVLKVIVSRVKGLFGRARGEARPGKAADVIAEVRKAVAARAATAFRDVAEAQQMVRQVFAQYRRRGLGSLQLVETTGREGAAYDVVAAASPETNVGEVRIRTDVIGPKPGSFRTTADSQNRPYRVWGWLAKSGGARSTTAQTRVSQRLNQLMERFGLPSRFDAGHLIGDRYGGPGTESNLVPQEQSSNQSWYKTFEGVVAGHVERTKGSELIYADVRAIYPTEPFKDVIREEDLRGITPGDQVELAAALQRVPDAIRFARLGKRSVDGKEIDLPTPPPFSARQTMPSLGRMLRAIVLVKRPKRGREIFP